MNKTNEMLKAFELAVLDVEVKTLGRNLIEVLENEQLFLLTNELEHYKVGGRLAETGEHQYFVKYDGFKFDERFADLDFGDADYIETRITVADAMPFINGDSAFDCTDPSLYMLNLEHKMIDLLEEAKRGN